MYEGCTGIRDIWEENGLLKIIEAAQERWNTGVLYENKVDSSVFWDTKAILYRRGE